MNNVEHIKLIKRLLNGLAEYLQLNLTPGQLQMYAEDLSDLSLDNITQIVHCFRKSNKEIYGKFPLPGTLRALIEPTFSDRDVGNDVAGRIWESISNFGQYRAKDAEVGLGELAWTVVGRMGGWVSVCSTPSDERSFFFAQCRDVTESVQRLSLAGKLGYKHELPKIERNLNTPTSIANILPLIKNR